MSITQKVELLSPDPKRTPIMPVILATWTPPCSPFEATIRIPDLTKQKLTVVQNLVSDVEYTYKQHVRKFRANDVKSMEAFGARQEALLVIYRWRSQEQLEKKPDWVKWRELAEKEVKIRVRQMVWMDLRMVID